jgi:hypothetical protein
MNGERNWNKLKILKSDKLPPKNDPIFTRKFLQPTYNPKAPYLGI